jgi:hypothetical protein
MYIYTQPVVDKLEKVQNNVQAIQWPKEKLHSRLLVGFVLLDL